MTSSTAMAEHPIVAPQSDRARDRALLRRWLYLIATLIVAMVVVGGATRLTDSGLSITEWQPIHGTIPPLTEAEWQEEFAKYQKIPEYQILNEGMTLAEFKQIFWWEWAHRFLGRLTGAAFLLPLIFFWATGRIERGLGPRLLGIFVLGGLQGAVGWWMVASGLVERTDVSQYRLALHLTLACAILAYVLWVARGLADTTARAAPSLRWTARGIVALVFVQIFLGGLVAGIDAGQAYNTWPLMDGSLVPSGLLIQMPAWRNFFENALTVQFDHRTVAYLLLATALFHAVQARRAAYARQAALLALLVTAQAGLGVVTLIAAAPLSLALLHQLGAIAVLGFAVIHLRAISGGPMPAVAQSASA